jgi:hypothetical protein
MENKPISILVKPVQHTTTTTETTRLLGGVVAKKWL